MVERYELIGQNRKILYVWCKNMWLGHVDTKLQMVPVSSANSI